MGRTVSISRTPNLLNEVRQLMRVRHYSIHTKRAQAAAGRCRAAELLRPGATGSARASEADAGVSGRGRLPQPGQPLARPRCI